MLNTHRLTLLRLQTTSGIGRQTLHRILKWADNTEDKLNSVFYMESSELKQLFKLKDTTITALKASSTEEAEQLVTELYRQGIQIFTRWDDDYPSHLITTLKETAPPILYIQGKLQILSERGVSFCGSRRVSDQSISYAAQLALDSVKRGYPVISGHAPGVDVTTHRTALEHGGVTVFVLPEGILKFRLRANLRELFEQNSENALVVSEFPPHMSWSVGNAMARNRTIIGLSKALCVIEAGETGGTLNAGQTALKLSIPVLVLDHPAPPERPEGNTLLIQNGACTIPVTPHLSLPEPLDCNSSIEKPEQLSLF